MIDTKELRIGSLFQTINRSTEIHLPTMQIFVVAAIGYFDVDLFKFGECFATGQSMRLPINDLSPIPITPEILDKCGFVDGFIKLPFGNKLCIGSSNNGTYIAYFGEESGTLSKYYNYVHELQNLYFALTGEELNIEL